MIGDLVATVMVLQLLFVLLHLTVELVDQAVDGGVEVFFDGFNEDVLAGKVDSDFRLLLQLLHGEDDVDVDHMIKVTRHAFQLAGDVFTNGRRDFEVVSTDLQVHGVAPF